MSLLWVPIESVYATSYLFSMAGLVICSFRHSARFLLETVTLSPFDANLGMFPLDYISSLGALNIEDPIGKLSMKLSSK